MALKAYFQGKFDFFKYDGKIKINPSTYEKRKDRYFFQKLSKKYNRNELILFFVSNFVYYEDGVFNRWVGDLLTEASESIYLETKQIHDSLGYFFENDCQNILDDLEQNQDTFYHLFSSPNIPIFKLELKTESIIILNNLIRFGSLKPFEVISQNKNISPLWLEDRLRLEKYSSFVNYKASDMLKIFNKYFQKDRTDVAIQTNHG